MLDDEGLIRRTEAAREWFTKQNILLCITVDELKQ
jgi:hypothetical protein